MLEYTASVEEINASLQREIYRSVDGLLRAQVQSVRAAELAVWGAVLVIARLLLTTLLAMRCRRVVESALARENLVRDDVRFRWEADYQPKLNTTLGEIRVPLFAYRAKNGGETRNPALAEVLPLHGHCRSSELCFEWETRLGADHPFRIAQEELSFFSHGAITLEDNTIAAHMAAASAAVERQWLYRRPEDIREVLCERAAVDAISGRPVVYLSSDAHALRRYVSETWSAAWKMANGIRMWTVDRESGETIHLGGEYTWGDCEQVALIFKDIIDTGILPKNGDYGEGVVAKIVWISDGAPWFETRILPLFDEGACQVVLDAYHLLERLAEDSKAVFSDPKEAKAWSDLVAFAVTGKPRTPETVNAPRKGHKKKKRNLQTAAASTPKPPEQGPPLEQDETPKRLIDLIDVAEKNLQQASPQLSALREFIITNTYRIDYALYRHHGLHIGSGAMESQHRTGSQVRLKRSGARWLAETSQAILNWRMLKLAGRWDEFWDRPNLGAALASVWKKSPIAYPLPKG